MAGGAGIFAGIGALQGVGDSMIYQNHLRDALDAAHQQRWDEENAQASLEQAKTDQSIRYLHEVRGDTNDSQITKTRAARWSNASQSQPQMPQQQAPGAQPMAMPPAPGQMQPSATQGQVPEQAQSSAPIQPRTTPITPPSSPSVLPASLQVNGNANPTGRIEPQPQGQPQSPPPVGDRATNAPSEQLAMQQAVTKAMQTGDPQDMNYAKAGIVVNENTGEKHWVQENADMYKFIRNAYPNLNDNQILALVGDYASGNWKGTEKEPARQVFLDHVAKLDDQAAKYEGGPVNVSDLGGQAQEYAAANKNLGLSNKTTLQPLRPSEEIQSAGVMKAAQGAKQASEVGINTMNSLFSSLGVNNLYGPFAATTAKLETALSSMTDADVSKAVDSWWVQNKDSIVAANQMLRSLPGGSRAGIGLLNRETEGVPSATMSPQAERQMILQYYSSFRQAANYSDALLSGPARYTNADERIQHANEYAKQNPAVGADGVTPNPSFKEYNEWLTDVASGKKSTGPTEADIRKQGLSNMTNSQTPQTNKTEPSKNGPPAGLVEEMKKRKLL